MCQHNWIPFRIDAAHPFRIIDAAFYLSQIVYLQVTQVICVECLEVKEVAEPPDRESQRMIEEYRKTGILQE